MLLIVILILEKNLQFVSQTVDKNKPSGNVNKTEEIQSLTNLKSEHNNDNLDTFISQ